MGLAFSTIAKSDSKTFFENLMSQNTLASNVFSFHLERGSASLGAGDSGDVKNGGSLIFGGYDSSLFNGNISYQVSCLPRPFETLLPTDMDHQDVTVQGYWETRFNGFAVNGTVVDDTTCQVGML